MLLILLHSTWHPASSLTNMRMKCHHLWRIWEWSAITRGSYYCFIVITSFRWHQSSFHSSSHLTARTFIIPPHPPRNFPPQIAELFFFTSVTLIVGETKSLVRFCRLVRICWTAWSRIFLLRWGEDKRCAYGWRNILQRSTGDVIEIKRRFGDAGSLCWLFV